MYGIKSIGSEFAERMYFIGKEWTTTMAERERNLFLNIDDY